MNFEYKLESEFARLHPLVSFLYFVGVILIAVLSVHPVMLLIGFFVSLVYQIRLCGIESVKSNLLILVPILIFTVIIQPLFNNDGVTPIFYISGNMVSVQAVLYGVAMAGMLITAIQWFRSYNVIVTTDKFLYLFGRILPSLTLLISMIIRTIPLLRNRFVQIEQGQKALGMKYDGMGLQKKGRLLIKEISILIAWSLEASIETADSMEARGYGTGRRTSFHLFHFQKKDACCLGIEVILIIGCLYGVFNDYVQAYYFPVFVAANNHRYTAITCLLYLMLSLFPMIYDIGGVLRWKQLNSKM